MSQNSLVLPTTGTLSGLSLVTDVNSALDTLNTLNSGGSAPSTTGADMLWMDTTNGLLKQRDSGNASWLPQAVRGYAHGGGMRFSGVSSSITGSGTLTNSILGQLLDYAPSAAITSTLPLAGTFPAGTGFVANNSGPGAVTFALQGGNSGDAGLYAAPGDQLMLVSDGSSYWRVLFRSTQYSQSLGTSGFVRTVGGLIHQWGSAGQTTNSAGGGTIVFPEAFPNAVFTCLLTVGDNNAPMSVQSIAEQLTLTAAGYQMFSGGSPLESAAVRVNWHAFGN